MSPLSKKIITISMLSAALACSDDSITVDTADATSTETGDGDGDAGDGDGDPATDTDTETETDTGDGDGDPTTGDGDGDPTTGDGDGDPTTGDGDGDEPPPAECGNGVVEDGEECDDGNDVDSDECTTACTAAACGDGIVWEGMEECDDGNDVDTDECTLACVAATCGDGIVWEGMEECDDGNDIDTDDCVAGCVAATCGDGIIWEGNETCEDGNVDPGDGCSDMCVTEPYFVCDENGCNPLRIMYAIANTDDANYRAAVGAVTGGPVTYVDARSVLPTIDEALADYDCIFTHPNNSYGDSMGWGTMLAEFADNGRVVVLGIASGFQPPTGLAGTPIYADGYSPVTTGGNVDFNNAAYQDDGVGPLHVGVSAYANALNESGVTLQGEGIQDGSLTGDIIATAHRPDFRVVYLNGTGHAPFQPTGDWDVLLANACATAYSLPPMPPMP